jgi:hypothetical protein
MLRGRLHGAFWMASFISDKPFVAETCDIEVQQESQPIKGRLHGAFSISISMSDKPFDAEARDIGGQASATNGLSDATNGLTDMKNAPCYRPLNRYSLTQQGKGRENYSQDYFRLPVVVCLEQQPRPFLSLLSLLCLHCFFLLLFLRVFFHGVMVIDP